MLIPYYRSEDRGFTLLKGDCIELLNSFDFKFDMIERRLYRTIKFV